MVQVRDDGRVEQVEQGAGPRSRRRVWVTAAAWLLAAGAAGTIVWRAVAVLDADGDRVGVLSAEQVTAELAAASAAATATATTPSGTPTPSATSSATSSPTDTPTSSPTAPGTASPTPDATTAPPLTPPSTEVVRVWDVAGGVVSASCTGQAITLLYAAPADGWTVEVGSTGPEHVEVELRSGETETKVRAVCVAGVPEQEVRQDDGGEQDDD